MQCHSSFGVRWHTRDSACNDCDNIDWYALVSRVACMQSAVKWCVVAWLLAMRTSWQCSVLRHHFLDVCSLSTHLVETVRSSCCRSVANHHNDAVGHLLHVAACFSQQDCVLCRLCVASCRCLLLREQSGLGLSPRLSERVAGSYRRRHQRVQSSLSMLHIDVVAIC
jgi:hypothetical protein